MLLLKETMPCLVLVTTKMIFTNKKTSSKYHIFDQNKDLSSVLVRSTVRYGSVRFCIFFRGSVRCSGRPKPNKTEGSAEVFGRIIRPNVHSVFAEYSAEEF